MDKNSIPEDWKNITDPKERLKAYYKAYKKVWCKNNKDKLKTYWLKCRNKKNEKQKIYRKENKEKVADYYKTNKDKIRVHLNNKLKTDIQFKLSHNLRARLHSAIKGNYKVGSAVKDLGCTVEELKQYLESKFQSGMSWDNWSSDGWHIDHIKPLASFDLMDRQQLLEACHYTNLQPLWANENLTKSDKII